MKDQFRLLGIKTGERTTSSEKEKDYLRILSENTYYPFYSCFDFVGEEFTYFPEEDIDLFNQSENKLNIQVSAIVGKNGSGKSTLLELLYLANYNLGSKYNLLEQWVSEGDPTFDENCNEIKNGYYDDCEPIPLNFELYFQKNKTEIIKIIFNEIDVHLYKGISNDSKINFDEEPLTKFDTNLKELANFFYSIAINYSIYGLNSNISGEWIIPLFHKNDGYKTPLVINPKRNYGNLNINEEMEFATYRLVSNILIQQKSDLNSPVHVTDKQQVTELRFRINPEKIKKKTIKQGDDYISGDIESLNILLDLYAEFYGEVEQLEIRLNKIPFKEKIQNYVVQKANKILRIYDEYSIYLIKKEDKYVFDFDKKDVFAKALNLDNSHITFKLKQALNFLRNEILVQTDESKWKNDTLIEWISFTPQELLDWMQTDKIEEIIQHIPPSIFDIEIGLSDGFNNADSASHFGDLSSGEQQMIHSVNTVLYHVNNLQSAHFSNDGRLAYEHVNVIFDEVELYFHPEYQRKFISFLIDSVNRLPLTKTEDNKGLKSINFLFSTHSPFILSDIPKQNILTLSICDKTKKAIPIKILDQTFGGNIHDLLANSFFLDKGYVGEKAVEIINDVIKKLNKWTDEPKNRNQVNENEKDYVKKVISLIGNELVKGKLVEMYLDCFNEFDFREKLASEYELIAKKLRGDD